MNVFKGMGLVLVALLSLPAWAADAVPVAEQRYEALQQRISQACQAEPQGDLCQVYLHGLLEGVQATGTQVERLAAGWARLHEQADRRHPYAWLARDILHASSCSPDALAFLQGFAPARASDVRRQASDHVAAHCQPDWVRHRLEAPVGAPGYIITQR